VGRFETLGYDLVNHCIDDILVQGARPLFFLDYVASSRLDPDKVLQIVTGISGACRQAGCALLGGETAEMPGVYQPGEIDLAGTIVGWVERDRIIDGSRIACGDVLVGLPSTGLHTNGYSLARKVLANTPLNGPSPDGEGTLGDALLAPHRSYLEPVTRLHANGVDIKGMAHITGGGFYDNIPRILPAGMGAKVEKGTWPDVTIFRLIQEIGQVAFEEMYRVFNMGIGLIVFLSPGDVSRALHILEGDSYRIGEVVPAESQSPRVVIS
jgi:phosphoribosylformylglycinamidine cyclo-ligase